MPWLAYVTAGSPPDPLMIYFGERTSSGAPPTGAALTARDAFMARLTVSGAIGFEGIADNEPLHDMALSCNGVTATFTTYPLDPLFASTVQSATFAGLYPVSGSKYAQMRTTYDDFTNSPEVDVYPTVLSFSEAVSAFGFYTTDAGDTGGRLSIKMFKSGGGSDTYTVAHSLPASEGFLCFWGIVNTAQTYTGAEIIISSPNEAIAFDDIVLATAAQLA